MPEYEVVIQERVKNWYKNEINQESGDSWLASHMVNCGLSQPSVKDTTMIPKWLIIRCWNPRWWNSTVHANNVNSLGNKHSSIATDCDLKTNTFSSLTVHSSSLLSSPLSHALVYFLLVFVVVTKLRLLSWLPTFQRNEAECSAIMLVTMNNPTQLYILDQTNTTKFIITTAYFVTVLPK